MAITNGQRDRLDAMCPIAQENGLGTLLQRLGAGDVVLRKQITLAGSNPTAVDFGTDFEAADMADTNYTVLLCPVTTTPGTAPKSLAVANKAVGGFDIYAETPAAIPCDVLVIGTPA